MKKRILLLCFLAFCINGVKAQESVEKADHVEPLVNDFTTDLGAPKGDKEINFQLGFSALEKKFDLQPQVEFEFSPIKRLGLEIEVPFSLNKGKESGDKLKARLPALEWAAQYTIFSKPASDASLAISYQNGYVFKENSEKFGLEQITHLPYLIYAKSLTDRYYFTGNIGPEIIQTLDTSGVGVEFKFGGSFHYKFKQINYIGFEYSQTVQEEESEAMFYPQYFFEFTDKFTGGATIGIPLTNFDTKFYAMIRASIQL